MRTGTNSTLLTAVTNRQGETQRKACLVCIEGSRPVLHSETQYQERKKEKEGKREAQREGERQAGRLVNKLVKKGVSQ